MTLEEYRKTRDFKKSPEPFGEAVKIDASRFVVQRHQARQLHYDFRLEREGVLKSWAVPKGLPINPGVKRLAVSVEDHPVDYIGFSGTIPDGGYGAGEVGVWDKGNYRVLKWDTKEIAVVLEGQILNGNYVLINTGGKNWIIFKKT